MRVFWERAADTPLVSIGVLARGGAALDDEGFEGFAHHLAELAVRGAGALDRRAIDTEFDRIGTSLSVTSSRDHIGYTARCLSRHADRVVEILADVLAEPRFDADEHQKLVRETHSDLEEIRDDDGDLVARFFSRHFWPSHPYARALEGSDASLARIASSEAAVIADRYRQMLCRDNLVLAFSGDLEERDVTRFTESLTGRLDQANTMRVARDVERPSATGNRVFLVEKPQRSQAQILIGHPAPHYASDDGPALLLAEAAFGGMFSSRLMQEVRVKRGWSYDAGIHLARAARPSWIRMSLAPNTEVATSAIELVIEEYRRLIADGLRAEELDLARRYTIGGMLLSRATARHRVRQAGIGAINETRDDFVETLPDALEALSLKQVNGAIARHLSAEALTIVAVGGAALAPELERFGDLERLDFRSY